MTPILKLLDSPDKWIKDSLAETKDGKYAHFLAPDATKFCLVGAAARIYDNPDSKHKISYMKALERLRAAVEAVGYKHASESTISVVDFNNDPATTYDDIVRVVQMAGV